MANSQALVLVIQATRLQGLLWQAFLRSQWISVVWEPPTTDLVKHLDSLKEAGLELPDLLLVDICLPNFQADRFCQWCRQKYPEIKLVLTSGFQQEVLLSERRWAIYQGAADLLPGFHYQNLFSSATACVKRVLEILGSQPLQTKMLISVLLTLKRQLELRHATFSTSLSHRKTIAKTAPSDQKGQEKGQVVYPGKGSFQTTKSLENLQQILLKRGSTPIHPSNSSTSGWTPISQAYPQ